MENLNPLGRCCICETTRDVVNIITLDVKIPDGERQGGWGCFVCGLEARGAVAVLCDGCAPTWKAGTPIKFACLGYPGADRRIEIEKLTEPYQHDISKHPEENFRLN